MSNIASKFRTKLKSDPAFLISLVAIILSQLKPIYTYFQNYHFEFSCAKYLSIYHSFGNLTFAPYITINNIGEADGHITDIDIFVQSENKQFQTLKPAYTYFLTPTATTNEQTVTQVPFAPIIVRASSSWMGTINFFAQRTDEFCAEVNSLYSEAFMNLRDNKTRLNKDSLASPLFSRIEQISNISLNDFRKGKYYLLARYFASGERPKYYELFHFSIDELNYKAFLSITKDYMEGYGITKQPRIPGIGVELREVFDPKMIKSIINNCDEFMKSDSL